MRNLFQRWYPCRWSVFLSLVLLSVGMMAILAYQGQALNDKELAPKGIISLEIAFNEVSSREIIEKWEEEGVTAVVARNLWIDFIFLIIYSTTLAFGCWWVAQALANTHEKYSALGKGIVMSQWGAALFDIIENIFLLLMLNGVMNQAMPFIATAFAVLKFTLVTIGLLFILIGGLLALATYLRQRIKPAQHQTT